VNQARQGVASLDQGQKEYQTAKGKDPKAADAGVQKMIEGGRMVQESLKVIQDGVKMNNDVLRAKGLASQVEAPTKTILIQSCSLLTTYGMLFSERRKACANPRSCRRAL
jgi:hypothetical protein